MGWNNRKADRVTFATGYSVLMMGIDGTWQRPCTLLDISNSGALLQVKDSIEGLNLREFFLLLSSTGLAFRRCELVRVNGDEIGVKFAEDRVPAKKAGKKKSRALARSDS
ncbi:type IV pilus assembly PilZ [Nitrobacter hamburgensis X14]|uniref:Type IV pilus assembly PilZ n=1 Tax=Nitrobacter hamburgensis (strain DSM 10229 / NCIMB 13809 / X14) TaxID=323097 RepID=Q1QQW4_NITHX|nr:PilZ domain-containing protein [Nitrobacter hamburgensis]ABE61383.1 type IV pilus assembly PilZ [Nitrobacter hamburgensis X14]